MISAGNLLLAYENIIRYIQDFGIMRPTGIEVQYWVNGNITIASLIHRDHCD